MGYETHKLKSPFKHNQISNHGKKMNFGRYTDEKGNQVMIISTDTSNEEFVINVSKVKSQLSGTELKAIREGEGRGFVEIFHLVLPMSAWEQIRPNILSGTGFDFWDIDGKGTKVSVLGKGAHAYKGLDTPIYFEKSHTQYYEIRASELLKTLG